MRIMSDAGRTGSRRYLAVRMLSFAGLLLFSVNFSEPVRAQGFFESLFGGGSSKPAPRRRRTFRPVQTRRYGRTLHPARMPYPLPGYDYGLIPQRPRTKKPVGKVRQQFGNGSYRTMCVRSCDGYYFPISFNVPRSRFGHDADVCRTKCSGGDARLYYMPSQASPKKMIDMRGRQYVKTKTAFLFRKKRVQGCRCRPAAWSSAELYRHKMYELNEPRERKLARMEGDVEFLAGITKVRKAVLSAKKAAIAAAAARRRAEAETRRLAELKRINRAGRPGREDGRRVIVRNSHSGRRKWTRKLVISTNPPLMAADPGEPSFYSGSDHFADDYSPSFLNPVRSRQRVARFENENDSSRNVRALSRRDQRHAHRTAQAQYARRRRVRKKTKTYNVWLFGGPNPYRWPGD